MFGPNQLILTVDFEVFGNGSGHVDHCACKPLDRMAALVEAHNGRLEIFVDALEFSVMETNPGHSTLISGLKRQLADMVRRGHHLQLHLHPQWEGAQFQDGKWNLDPAGWRIGGRDIHQVRTLLEQGQAWLSGSIADAHQEGSCIAFRAGGWCIQPSASVVSGLRSIGVRIDSTVAPGMVNVEPSTWYDFEKCPEKAWWPVDEDVASLGTGDFIEIPIATGRVNPVRHIIARSTRRREGEFADGCAGTYQSRAANPNRLIGIWQKIRHSDRTMLDYCGLSAGLMIDVVEDWTERVGNGLGSVPVVAIGHSKNFSRAAERELDKFLTWATTTGELHIGDYQAWLNEVSL